MTFNLSEFKRLAGEKGGGKWIYFFNNEGSFGIRCTEVPKDCDDHLLYITHDMYCDAIAINPKEAEFIAYCGTHADVIIERLEKLEKVAEFYSDRFKYFKVAGQDAIILDDLGETARKALEERG